MTELNLTPAQRTYAAGWNDPAVARRRRIEALVAIVEGLDAWNFMPGLEDDYAEAGEGVYYRALRTATRSLLWDLAWTGGLDGAHVFDECGERYQVIRRLDASGPDPMLLITYEDGKEGGDLLTDFADNMIESYVGLPGTKAYGGSAIVELARR